LRSFEETLAELSEFGDQVLRFAAGKGGSVNRDGQLLGDSEIGATRQAEPFGPVGKFKQFSAAATNAALETGPLLTALGTA